MYNDYMFKAVVFQASVKYIPVADPGIFQRGGSTLKVGFQRGGGPLLFWVFKGGLHPQNALF
jgi:hypothetical protein